MSVVNTIMNGWQSWLTAIVVIVALAFAGAKFVKTINKSKIEKWLIWACSVAEMELGSGTGKLKLANVYNMFVGKFPWISTLFSYADFAIMVDIALTEMKKMIETNKDISKKITGEEIKEEKEVTEIKTENEN